MADVNISRGPFGVAQITVKCVAMKAIGTLAPTEPEMTKIYRTRAERCLLQARAARSGGRLDVMQQLFDAAKFWLGHADAIETALRGGKAS
jgi:hypothetical protein